MNKEIAKLTQKEETVIDDKLMQGVVNRASTLSFIFATSFFIYSFTSHEFLKGFDSTLTIFDNTWPRVLFNTLPLVLLGLYFRQYNIRSRIKAWIWVFSLPLIFLSACLIHVWPLIWNGNPDVYFFVHSANVFILTSALIVVAPPPRLILAQTLCFIMLVVAPLALIFLKIDDMKMLRFALGDLLIVIPASAYISYAIHRLRLKIALFDHELKRIAAPFLGATLTDAIYNQKSELLDNRNADAVVVQIDIRGYTGFYRTSDPVIVKKFMASYHNLVSRCVGQHGGYWHKSVGDAHIISFGAMEAHDDLSMIPGSEKEISSAALRKKRHHVESMLSSILAITSAFNELKEMFDVDEAVGLGIGVASGEIEVRIQGDDNFRKELDIDGAAMIRAARLEEFTKTIRKHQAPESSVVAISPELSIFVEMDPNFRKWEISDEEIVRNFPEIRHIFFCAFQNIKTKKRNIRIA